MNQLDSIKKFTKIAIDSGDVNIISNYDIQDATTNPSIIFKISDFPKYQNIIEKAIKYAKNKGGSDDIKLINANNKLIVDISTEILKIIPGRISVEIDIRFSFNTIKCVDEAYNIINLFKENYIDKSRILIKLASTWEGIQAAKRLEKKGINCNLTLLFSFAQAQACAEAGVYLISPFVGRIYDWYKQYNLMDKQYFPEKDPGVTFVHKIFDYYKKYNYKTIIMGASFRRIEQIQSLVGCDYLTISPNLLEKLKNNYDIIKRKLHLPKKNYNVPDFLSESEFRWNHNKNLMAVYKLAEGIHQFAIDQKKLRNILAKNL